MSFNMFNCNVYSNYLFMPNSVGDGCPNIYHKNN
mgnify:CR=1 FL=1